MKEEDAILFPSKFIAQKKRSSLSDIFDDGNGSVRKSPLLVNPNPLTQVYRAETNTHNPPPLPPLPLKKAETKEVPPSELLFNAMIRTCERNRRAEEDAEDAEDEDEDLEDIRGPSPSTKRVQYL